MHPLPREPCCAYQPELMIFFSIVSIWLIAESLLIHIWETWTKKKDVLSLQKETNESTSKKGLSNEPASRTSAAKKCHCRKWRRKGHSKLMLAFSKRRKLARTIKITAAELKELENIYNTSTMSSHKSRDSTKERLSETCNIDVGIKRSGIDDFVKTTGQQGSTVVAVGAKEHLNKEIRNPKTEVYDSDDVQRKIAKYSAPSLPEVQSRQANTDRNRTVQRASRGFLTDEEIAAAIPFQPKGPRRLIPWRYFIDGDDQDFELDSVEGESWDSEEMFEVNEIKFGYRSTYDEKLTEYTTVLDVKKTKKYRKRWLRACSLEDEIKASKYRGEPRDSNKKKTATLHK